MLGSPSGPWARAWVLFLRLLPLISIALPAKMKLTRLSLLHTCSERAAVEMPRGIWEKIEMCAIFSSLFSNRWRHSSSSTINR